MVIHKGRIVRRLTATATVIGAFEKWRCDVRRSRLDPGDLLVVFSDGITEAVCGDEQFGDQRLIDLLLANRGLPVDGIADAVLSGVQAFSAGRQSDDLTLIVASVHEFGRGHA